MKTESDSTSIYINTSMGNTHKSLGLTQNTLISFLYMLIIAVLGLFEVWAKHFFRHQRVGTRVLYIKKLIKNVNNHYFPNKIDI